MENAVQAKCKRTPKRKYKVEVKRTFIYSSV